MADSRALEDALTCDSSTFYCIATDGGEVVALPTDLAPYAASCEPPENPTSLFDPASYGTVISTFLAAITEGYGVTIVMMTDGSSRQVEIFNRFDELGCGIVCLTETDAIPEFEQATPLELPTRRVTSRMNGAGRTLDVDEGITRLLGWTVDEYVGLSSVDKIHPDDQERAIRAFAELLGRPNGQSRTRQRVRHKDGTWRWFEITHTNLLDADDSHILSESIDISDEMQVTLETPRARDVAPFTHREPPGWRSPRACERRTRHAEPCLGLPHQHRPQRWCRGVPQSSHRW